MTADASRKIVIASFATPGGAEAALHLLKAAPVSLGNVAIVTREPGGEVKFTETQDWGIGKSALIGAIAGLLLPGVGTITMWRRGPWKCRLVVNSDRVTLRLQHRGWILREVPVEPRFAARLAEDWKLEDRIELWRVSTTSPSVTPTSPL